MANWLNWETVGSPKAFYPCPRYRAVSGDREYQLARAAGDRWWYLLALVGNARDRSGIFRNLPEAKRAAEWWERDAVFV